MIAQHQLLDAAFERLGLSGAGAPLRAAGGAHPRLADMAGADRLAASHVAEAVQYRPEGMRW